MQHFLTSQHPQHRISASKQQSFLTLHHSLDSQITSHGRIAFGDEITRHFSGFHRYSRGKDKIVCWNGMIQHKVSLHL